VAASLLVSLHPCALCPFRIKPRYERLQDAGVSLEDSPAYTFLSLLFLSEQKFQARMEQHMDQDMFQTRLEQHLQEQGVTGEL
jgi:hypothetical protein